VTSGFAGVKFSGSPNRLGENKARIVSGRNSSVNPKVSLAEKYG